MDYLYRSKMRKADLLRAIGEARAAEWRKRLRRALQTGRYPAITRGDIENPHKKWQRARELRQLAREVDAALLAEGVRKRTTPTMRAEARRRIENRRAPLARSIVAEGPRILEELDGEREGEQRGRRFWKWSFFRGVADLWWIGLWISSTRGSPPAAISDTVTPID